ncbi:MAG: hypothetical protein O3A92_10965 [Verrucomicrobia bacterium]|nr:hypothetical protein [Verrucomicrobiota bacterium]
MIEQLVSSNPPTTGEWNEEPPPPWTNEENWRVQELVRAIAKYEKAAVPALIDNLDRQEYAMSISTAVPHSPMTIGDVCRSTIESMSDPIGMMYKSRSNAKDESMMGSSYLSQLRTKEDFEKWWIQNRGKSVAEIQREARDWHVARESAFGFTDAQQQEDILDQIEFRYTGIPRTPPSPPATTTEDSEADADPFADGRPGFPPRSGLPAGGRRFPPRPACLPPPRPTLSPLPQRGISSQPRTTPPQWRPSGDRRPPMSRVL